MGSLSSTPPNKNHPLPTLGLGLSGKNKESLNKDTLKDVKETLKEMNKELILLSPTIHLVPKEKHR